MRRTTQTLVVTVLVCLVNFAQLYANRITSAYISDKASDRLTVEFDSPVQASNAAGFRLTGGAARIKELIAGNGSNTLTFSLTDHVLPDDQFSILYWPELGNASSAGQQLVPTNNLSVSNLAQAYKGSGELFFVATNGNDRNDGLSESRPFRTINRAQQAVEPGDYILLRRGDTFNTHIVVQKSGKPGQYITFAAYGKGDRPVVDHDSEDTFVVDGKSYVAVDNLHFKVRGGGEAGVHFMGNTSYPIVSNCRIEGLGRPHYGINYGKNDGGSKVVVYPQLLNNYITGFRWNIRSSGYPYDGTHEVRGGLIENNICKDNYKQGNDGISAQRGKYHGLIIRKNEVSGWYDDGMDFFSARDVIVEYNVLHSPQQPAVSGQGIKAGGITGNSDKISGHQSENIIVRYNKVYNLYNRATDQVSHNGIQTNGGKTGKVYGNIVYDVQGTGIVVSGNVGHWEVHHNTVVNAGKDGLQLYTSGSTGGNVDIRNNILEGKNNDLRCIIKGEGRAKGERNILTTGKSDGAYTSSTDMKVGKADLFTNYAQKNFRLKPQVKAIDAGVAVEGYTKGRSGIAIQNKPDIGAFEFGGASPAPAPAPAPAPSPEPPEPTPSPELLAAVNIANPTNGIAYKYYEGSYSKLPDFSKLKVVESGYSSSINLSKRNKDNDIGFVFTGYFKAPKDGVYTFYTTSDDGSRLFIGDHKVVDNDGMHAARERSGTIGLKAGFHAIKVTFFERSGSEILQVRVKTPSGSKRGVAASELFVDKKTEEEPAPKPTPLPTTDNGLNYRYYEGFWKMLPNFSELKPIKEGGTSGFDLSVREREEKFGIVYYGYVQIDEGDEYTFYTKSDDGSTLYINGKKVVDNDGLHAPQERSGKIALSAGRHKIEVHFFERTVGQVLEVRYASSSINKQLIPSTKLYAANSNIPEPTPSPEPAPSPQPTPPADEPIVDAKPGLRYKYYEGRWGALPNFGSLKVIKSGTINNFSLSPARQDRYFGLVYVGYIKIKNSGDYTFYTTSDDGSKLYINGKQLVDNDRVHPARERSGKVRLNAGYHKIEVRYFENAYGEELKVSYQGPGVSKRAIPDAVLFIDKPTTTKTAVATSDKSNNSLKMESINQTLSSGSAKIYPNPANGIVNVQMNAQDAKVIIKLKNMAGHVLHEKVVSNTILRQTVQIDLSALLIKSGMYVVSVEGDKVGSFTFRLIRE